MCVLLSFYTTCTHISNINVTFNLNSLHKYQSLSSNSTIYGAIAPIIYGENPYLKVHPLDLHVDGLYIQTHIFDIDIYVDGPLFPKFYFARLFGYKLP